MARYFCVQAKTIKETDTTVIRSPRQFKVSQVRSGFVGSRDESQADLPGLGDSRTDIFRPLSAFQLAILKKAYQLPIFRYHGKRANAVSLH